MRRLALAAAAAGALMAGQAHAQASLAQSNLRQVDGPATVTPTVSFDQAVADRLAGKLDIAIQELRVLSRTAPMDADVWLNLGLALTAKGDFDAAEGALKQGLEVSPHYQDLIVAYARLAFFRQHPGEARDRLQALAGGRPNADAQELLGQITSAEREAMGLPWRIDASASYSFLSQNLPPWREYDLSIGQKLDRYSSFSIGMEVTDRFAITNHYFHGEYSRRFGEWSGFAGVGGSPDAVYRAREFVQGGVAAPAVKFGGGWYLVGELDAAYGRYPADEAFTLTPSLTLSWADRFTVQGRYIYSHNREGQVGGYAIQANAQLLRWLGVNFGYGDAPDNSSGIAVKVKQYAAGLTFDLDQGNTIRINGAHETGRVYTRDDYSVGLTHRF